MSFLRLGIIRSFRCRKGARRIQRAVESLWPASVDRGLPAGEYAIALAEDVEPADLADAAFLTRLLRSARTFTLRDGEQVTLDLRLRQ